MKIRYAFKRTSVQWKSSALLLFAVILNAGVGIGCQTTGRSVARTYTLHVLGKQGTEFQGNWKADDQEKRVQGKTPAIFEVRASKLEATFERVEDEGALGLRITEGNRSWGETVAEPPKSTVNATIHDDGATWFISY